MKKTSDIELLEKQMGHSFRDRELLRTALTHSSYAHQFRVESYERLEFLGDAILGFIIAQELYLDKKFPEGMSTRIRAALVCEDTLAELSFRIGIDRFALLGTGAENCGERRRKSILADMFEAHVAALYLDAGMDAARDYVLRVYGDRIKNVITEGHFVDTDYKSRLQEMFQSKVRNVSYIVVNEEGPVHDCIFTVDAVIDGAPVGEGISNSKKKAQQLAAKNAMEKIAAIKKRREEQGLAVDNGSLLRELCGEGVL